ncbi:MAG: hypothetical protein QT08_C0003G0008 [archaeon GW2011_AR17]|nr:MAG: hypothetical protein QT08_C0003G0008 [archaeon GW2011_AR17]MBS3154674.1 hypothetical protein [Candidatus Woesearchaeota archaeon]HIH15001.1 hypothetical protein [Nanoarchaeota archaeon]HIH58729.1 hypothetical protein [Nanoarchaeota archaeon]HII13643.1 hypothetical protein [Nanoarchaeota archaeon]
MQEMRFLNSKERKELFQKLEEQFAAKPEIDCLFFENSQDKVFLLSKDYASFDVQALRVNNRGMYFAKREREGLRLTIEGAQLLKARKNVVLLDKKQAELWMLGEDIPMEGNQGFIILQHGEDILGCGMLKNNILRNMVPKERRLHSITASQEEKEDQ